ncbi:hypothetical protein GBAR_LOCUS17210, partial [Geodia barretti]
SFSCAFACTARTSNPISGRDSSSQDSAFFLWDKTCSDVQFCGRLQHVLVHDVIQWLQWILDTSVGVLQVVEVRVDLFGSLFSHQSRATPPLPQPRKHVIL